MTIECRICKFIPLVRVPLASGKIEDTRNGQLLSCPTLDPLNQINTPAHVKTLPQTFILDGIPYLLCLCH